MGKEFKDWVDEFVENGANPKDVTNWPENAGGGGSIEIFEWNQGVNDMTDEVMEKLVAGKMILKAYNGQYFFYATSGEESGDDYTCRHYKFSCIPSRWEESGTVCTFTQIEFRKYSYLDRYLSNTFRTEMKQPTPMVEIWSGTLSSDNKLHYTLDDDNKKAWMQNLYDGAILNIDIDWIPGYNNKILYQSYSASGLLKYVSALDGNIYGLYTIEFIKINDEPLYEMTISYEIYNIADHIEVSYPSLPGSGTQYTLAVGDKGGLSIHEALEILSANILKIRQFNILAMLAGSDETSGTFTTPVFNNSYYSIVLTPVGDKELTAIEVNITENAVGGSVIFDMDYYDNSEQEEVEGGPILLAANNSNTWNNAKIYEEFNKGKICFIKCDYHRAFVSRITYFSGVYTVLLVGDTIEPGQMSGFGWDQENQRFFMEGDPK